MPIYTLIKKLCELFLKNPYYQVYINSEPNIEDEFVVRETDAGNIDIIPSYKFEELKDSQEFKYI